MYLLVLRRSILRLRRLLRSVLPLSLPALRIGLVGKDLDILDSILVVLRSILLRLVLVLLGVINLPIILGLVICPLVGLLGMIRLILGLTIHWSLASGPLLALCPVDSNILLIPLGMCPLLLIRSRPLRNPLNPLNRASKLTRISINNMHQITPYA